MSDTQDAQDFADLEDSYNRIRAENERLTRELAFVRDELARWQVAHGEAANSQLDSLRKALHKIAASVIDAQQADIERMRAWIVHKHGPEVAAIICDPAGPITDNDMRWAQAELARAGVPTNEQRS